MEGVFRFIFKEEKKREFYRYAYNPRKKKKKNNIFVNPPTS